MYKIVFIPLIMQSINCVTVFRCDPPPFLLHGSVDTTSTLYGKSITYQCLDGYKFADGAASKIITCGDDPNSNQAEDLAWGPQATIDSLICDGNSLSSFSSLESLLSTLSTDSNTCF